MTTPDTEPGTRHTGGRSGILRRVVQWSVLALLLFTCVMAAVRKFG